MVGQVGNDAFGPMLVENLRQAGVDTSAIGVSPGATGTAVILVLPHGENVIVIAPGANATLTAGPRDLERGSLLLTQLEIPLETTKCALRAARERGATTILDPAPAQELSADVLELVDFLTPNQTEAALLLGSDREVENSEEGEEAARRLVARGPATVVLKMGHLGVVIANGEGVQRVAGFAVDAVDTTAAGDTFNGAFAVALAEGRPVKEAARFANAAAALSVTRHGAQSSIPRRTEVDAFLANRVRFEDTL